MKKIFAALLALATSVAFGATLSPITLLNPAGSTSGQAIVSTGASSAPAWGGIGVNGIAAIAANTVLANATGSSANPTAFAMPSCSTGTSALQWTSGTGFTCASSLSYAPLASPAFTGTPTAPTAALTTRTTQLATAAFVGQELGNFSGIVGFGTATTLTNANAGNLVNISAAVPITLPAANSMPSGGSIVVASIANGATVIPQGADTINFGGNSLSSIVMNVGDQLTLTSNTAAWYVSANTHKNCQNIIDFGGDSTNTNDNSSAFARAAAAGITSGQVCVYFPPGNYAFSSQLVYSLASNNSITIEGAGASVTNLVWTGGGGMKINTANNVNSVHLKDFSVTTGSVNVGVGIFLNGTGSSGNAQANLSTIDNVLVQGSGFIATNYWSIGIEINNISNVNLKGVTVVGANAAYQTNGTGVYLVGASNASQTVQVNLIGCVLQYVGVGLNYGSNVEGVTVTATNFTGDANGIDITAAAGTTSGLSVTMSQFNSNVNAILNPNGIDGLFIVGNYFEIPYNGGATVTGINLGKQSSAVINGNVFERISSSATGTNGIVIAGPSTLPGMITGNTFESLGTGIWLQSTSDFVNVQSNAYQGNGTNVLNSSAAACPPTTSANCVGGGSP
jgi:hypothetical protein